MKLVGSTAGNRVHAILPIEGIIDDSGVSWVLDRILPIFG